MDADRYLAHWTCRRNIISRFDHLFRSNYRFLGETTLVSFSFLYGTRPTCLFVHAAKDSTTFFLPLRVSELQNPPASAIHEASRPSKKKPPMAIITTSLTRFNFLVSDSMLVGPIHTVLKLPDDTDCQTDAPTLIAFV
ncbi:hypothetical protein FOQG_03827 [Fusarium oxysporum f. sp. raphani 54005]|uniref:Uncharacterized protein n=2 Tax=Fusarium oxysporum TaxID=5507 RepID=X0CL87_FUSOX|nr:hypothetical protein FOQG_03827 [Fusarium oxysporum f. sp. raphani 54005]EXL69372.1 hypothetical protein FOPG_14664 [Fusarium oxysporum f. sp. conglutinans race 2 54008]KAI8405103.1 hypothetical protein FOFC_14582 [Fusarium oxysporum]